jgi:16S rRNA (guanine1207-N2)-methyltransferase
MIKVVASAVYGAPTLARVPAGARQLSPLIPSADALEQIADATLDSVVIAAPPGALERRYVLAQALRALKAGGMLAATAPKDRGGLRLRKELAAFGCAVAEQALRHQRLCVCERPAAPCGLDAAIAEGGPQLAPRLGLISQPGVFSWDRPDPGSVLLAGHLERLAGRGADLGCGVGVLALALLSSPAVTTLALVDLDRRAIDAARRNVVDPRAAFLQADLRAPAPSLSALDFVVMNPPFHDGGEEDRGLGEAFIQRAAAVLRRGGVLRLVANIGLPYEAALAGAFDQLRRLEQGGGYKVLEARRT